MSAVLSLATPDAAFMLTDGAAYNQAGVVHAIGRKVTIAKAVPFAVATRGHRTLGAEFAGMLCDGVDKFGVDLFLERLTEYFEIWRYDPRMRSLTAGERMIEVVLAGWSESRGGFHLKFRSDYENAFRIEQPDALQYSGPMDTDPREFLLIPEPGTFTPAGWLRRGGLDFMEACRGQLGKFHYGGGEPFYAIGGQCDLTSITADGVTVETLRIWPDVVGEKIDPERRAA